MLMIKLELPYKWSNVAAGINPDLAKYSTDLCIWEYGVIYGTSTEIRKSAKISEQALS